MHYCRGTLMNVFLTFTKGYILKNQTKQCYQNSSKPKSYFKPHTSFLATSLKIKKSCGPLTQCDLPGSFVVPMGTTKFSNSK